MATKKLVEFKKNQGQVLIKENVENPMRSIEELINAGVKQHQGGHYQRNRASKQLPRSFDVKPAKSRNSSVGHSREGSSDDGFGSTGRQTLSPSSTSSTVVPSYHPYNNSGSAIYHKKTPSAPALINYSPIELQPATTSRQIVPGLPPVAHAVSSRSLTAVSTMPVHHQHPQHSGSAYNISGPMQSPPMPQPVMHGGGSKSLDFDAVNHNLTVKQEQYGYPAGEMGTVQPGYYQDQNKMQNTNTQYWQDPGHRSHSLDPLTIAQMPEGSPQGLTSPIAGTSMDDGLGPMPKGWTKGYKDGKLYFIDHNHKMTTWFDPRIPDNLQIERIRQEHQYSAHSMPADPQYYQQHMQPHGAPTPGTAPTNFHDYSQSSNATMDRVNRLRMETKGMHERQQQLQQQGLLSPPQQQQQAHYQDTHMMHMQTGHPSSYQTSGNYMGAAGQQMDCMEVDYAHHTNPHEQQPQNPMDPVYVQDLEVNPSEFERYLCIDRKPQAAHFHS